MYKYWMFVRIYALVKGSRYYLSQEVLLKSLEGSSYCTGTVCHAAVDCTVNPLAPMVPLSGLVLKSMRNLDAKCEVQASACTFCS